MKQGTRENLIKKIDLIRAETTAYLHNIRNKIGQITFRMLLKLIGWFTFSENERKYYAIEKIIINKTVGESYWTKYFFFLKGDMMTAII